MKNVLKLLILLFCFFNFTVSVHASEFHSGESVTIPEQTVVEGNVFVSGTDIVVNGDVTGDVLCAGQNVTITGSVGGDVLCIAQAITVSGDVGGSVRTVSQNLSLEGSVARNVSSVGQNIGLSSNIGDDVYVAANQLVSHAVIAGSLYAAAETIKLNGGIGRDATVTVVSLSVSDTASIAGKLSYESQNDAAIASGSSIGSIAHTKSAKGDTGTMTGVKKTDLQDAGRKIGEKLWSLIILLGLGVLFVILMPKTAAKISEEMEKNAGLSFAVGFLTLCVVPMFMLMCIVTIIGIPFAALFGIIFVLFLLLARISVGLAVGARLLAAFKLPQQNNLVIQMIVGYILTWFVFSIPVLGGILEVVLVLWAIGAVIRAVFVGKK